MRIVFSPEDFFGAQVFWGYRYCLRGGPHTDEDETLRAQKVHQQDVYRKERSFLARIKDSKGTSWGFYMDVLFWPTFYGISWGRSFSGLRRPGKHMPELIGEHWTSINLRKNHSSTQNNHQPEKTTCTGSPRTLHINVVNHRFSMAGRGMMWKRTLNVCQISIAFSNVEPIKSMWNKSNKTH